MKNKFNILIFILWLLISLFALLHHEIWRDEAQVWCLVRDLNFFDIYNATRVEGHPILWYLLLTPFAKLGLPVESMQVLSFVFIGAAVVLFLWKSPFSSLEKTLVVFSAGMSYFLPVIARNYALIPMFLFGLAYCYPKRTEKPLLYSFLLFLLSQTHILMLGFCFCLFVLFLFENIKEKKYFLPLGLLCLNFLFLFYSFYGISSENVVVQRYSENTMTLPTLLKNFCYNYFAPLFTSNEILNCIIFYGALIIIGFYIFKENRKIFAVFITSFSYIFYIFAMVWFGGISYQKAYILLLILIFCYWVLNNNLRQLKVAFNTIFVISLLLSIPAIFNDFKYEFSGSKSLSKYIEKNLANEKFIYIGYPHGIAPLSAYLPNTKFFSSELGKYITYYDFNALKERKETTIPNEFEYYIVQQDFYLFEELGYELIFSTDEKIVGPIMEAEVYKIYKKKKAMT